MNATKVNRFSSLSVHAPALINLICVVGLIVVGLVALFSASQAMGDAFSLLQKQVRWLVIALIAFTMAARVDLEYARKYAWVIYALACIALLCVMVPGIGVKVKGAQRWIGIGSFRIQVSEFAKIGYVFILAHYFSVNQRDITTLVKGFIAPVIIIGLTCGLIIIEPDFGTAFLCGTVGFTMLFLAGSRMLYIIPTVLAGLSLFSVMVYHDPVRLKRVMSFLDVEGNLSDGAFQLWQGILAFGAGGINGVGLGQGRQQMNFLPEAHTDFIFAIVGEELGLFFTAGVVILFCVIFLNTIIHVRKSPNLFHFQLVMGCVLFITLQALINIGVVTGCLPTKGMSLPFISYGGSNLVALCIMMGLLVNVFRQWNKPTLPRPREL